MVVKWKGKPIEGFNVSHTLIYRIHTLYPVKHKSPTSQTTHHTQLTRVHSNHTSSNKQAALSQISIGLSLLACSAFIVKYDNSATVSSPEQIEQVSLQHTCYQQPHTPSMLPRPPHMHPIHILMHSLNRSHPSRCVCFF